MREPVNLHRLTIASQFWASKIEPKRAEADLLVLHRIKRISRELLVLFTDRQLQAGQIHLPVLRALKA